ncbi:trafficking regulator of GLUT4 1 [Panthera tigris]|uniref:trafficking regulator of GLUT4 1 n=1 Tax=Panthera leo TaxID=9689 RepID=UPI001C69AC4B|nr:trafficking regulator of GLUT4 1 [Panthera leo]XP_042823175.1 trafficking regulator of GLUT4 1 [Panthera tigris]
MANPAQPQFPPAREPGTASPTDLPEMEKLLTKVEGKHDKPLKLSKSLSGALDLEQNGHGLPFKVVSEGHQEAALPWSPSRASSRRASSVVTASSAQDQEVPRDYLILAITSCFCPVWPLNLIPLIFSIMSRSSVQQGDLDGARRLGRLARLLSITFIIMGIIIIIVAVTVNFAATPSLGVPSRVGLASDLPYAWIIRKGGGKSTGLGTRGGGLQSRFRGSQVLGQCGAWLSLRVSPKIMDVMLLGECWACPVSIPAGAASTYEK